MSGEGYEEGPKGIGIEELRKEGPFGGYSGKRATILIVDDVIDCEDNGGVAQGTSSRLWYALAHALAEKAIAHFDRGDVEPDRPGGRGNEEA